jgi:ribosomal protection tetracycline resistance protein
LARTLNLGIVAHVDAGKTSLTERLLFHAGVTDRLGSVDKGNTRTDTLALERQRGITIKAAVVTFPLHDVTINLIDTPGHPDFIAEVERVLHVLDGAILVISAVEGVQPQTRILMRALHRLGLPTLLFLNKTDRIGADPARVLAQVTETVTPQALWATEPSPEVLAEHDEHLMAAYIHGHISSTQVHRALAYQSRKGLVYPAFTGSAITGAGIPELASGITDLLPTHEGDPDGPLSGTVFKVERGAAGEKIAYVRLFSGSLNLRDTLTLPDRKPAKVTRLEPSPATAGHIAKVSGLTHVRIGDPIGIPKTAPAQQFAPPTLETVVTAADPRDKTRLHTALTQLAEQDPLINLRNEGTLSLYGEVQKEVIQATLALDYGLDVTFHETTTIYIERIHGTGEAVEYIYKNPFLATVGLRIEPAPIDSGIHFRLDVPVEAMPLFLYKNTGDFRGAVEETVKETLRQGLDGWQVTDCLVTMTHCGYNSPGTTHGDFRKLTPLVLRQALRNAGTVVCEPMHRFVLDIPPDTSQAVTAALARLGAVLTGAMLGKVTGHLQAAQVHRLQQQLPGLTRGEGVLESSFDHYRPATGYRRPGFPGRR